MQQDEKTYQFNNFEGLKLSMNDQDAARTRKTKEFNNDMINGFEGFSVAQHRSVKRTYTDNADSAATLAWKAPNFPRKKKKTIHLNEQQIHALPGM